MLEVPTSLWSDLISDLSRRGRGIRESGAFLLGTVEGKTRRVDLWIPYDELDPEALSKGYVRLDTRAFTMLWAKCSELGKVVVADVHTHPKGPQQSLSDMANPMVSQVGHLALIIPRFAQGKIVPSDLSVNVYLGAKRWSSNFGRDAETCIRLV